MITDKRTIELIQSWGIYLASLILIICLVAGIVLSEHYTQPQVKTLNGKIIKPSKGVK